MGAVAVLARSRVESHAAPTGAYSCETCGDVAMQRALCSRVNPFNAACHDWRDTPHGQHVHVFCPSCRTWGSR